MLMTFQTQWGRFCWMRLPYGLSTSSEIFLNMLHSALENLDGTAGIADDVMVCEVGDTYQEALTTHDVKLRNLLLRCCDKNI